MIRILIVDDHTIVRQGLNAIFDYEKDLEVVGECTDGTDVINFLKNKNVDIVLMDVLMPNQDGINTTRQVKIQYPEVKVMALSMQSDYSTIEKMLAAGANGYVLKSAGATEIVEAIHSVHKGNNYFTRDVTSSIMLNMMTKPEEKRIKPAPPSRELLNRLTQREIEILQHIAIEETNEEIAKALNISTGTVSTHRRNLLQKLEVRNSIGLAKFAYQSGLVTN